MEEETCSLGPAANPESKTALASLRSVFYYGPAHPCQESMFVEPPEGFRFVMNRSPEFFESYSIPPVYRPLRRAGVELLGRAFRAIGSPRVFPVFTGCDLVHIDGSILPITRKPWIVGGIEYASALFSFDDTWHTHPSARNALMRFLNSWGCRRILTYTHAALDSLRLGLGDEFGRIEHKCEVLPPVLPTGRLRKGAQRREDSSTVRILFVGNHFFDKGGRELFYAYRRLRARYDVELTMVTDAPEHHAEYFRAFKERMTKEPGVRLYSKVPRDFLWEECYGRSDIFCMPTYMDNLGFVLLEAMGSGLPVVASDAFAGPEIVRDGETGLLVHVPISSFERDRLRTPETLAAYRRAVLDEKIFQPVVDALEAALAKLIEDGGLRRRMGAAGFAEVERGRFSVQYRNRRLREIYLDSLG